MSKRKVVNKRRKARLSKSEGGKNSQYAQKLAQQKSGRFGPNSPFSSTEEPSEIGIGLAEFNRRRSKVHRES